MSRKKIIIYAIGACIIAGVGLTYAFTRSGGSQYIFETSKVERGTINNSVSATGTLEAPSTVEVGTQVSGVIEKLYVDFNSVVKKGQLIAELDKSTLQSTLETAEASLIQAQAEYDYQKKNLDRMKKIYDKGVLSESDYDEAVYNFEITRAGLKSAKANVDKAERNLGYASIYAPIDGIVLNRAVEEGQTVAASMETPELYTITNDLSEMQVEADVDEADIGMVSVGQKVEFTVDAFPEDTFTGNVSEIRLEPNEDESVVTYTVIVQVANPEKKLKPGMTATITVYVEEADNVLLAAGKAFRFTPDGNTMMDYMNSLPESERPTPPQGNPPMGNGNSDNSGQMQGTPPSGMQGPPASMPGQSDDDTHKTVWVKENSIIRPVSVEVGINDGSNYEIKSGLEEGQELVTSMTEGTKEELKASKESEEDEGSSSPFMPTPPKHNKGAGGPPPQ